MKTGPEKFLGHALSRARSICESWFYLDPLEISSLCFNQRRGQSRVVDLYSAFVLQLSYARERLSEAERAACVYLLTSWVNHPSRRPTPSFTSPMVFSCASSVAHILIEDILLMRIHRVMGTGIAWTMRHQTKTDFLSSNGTQTG